MDFLLFSLFCLEQHPPLVDAAPSKKGEKVKNPRHFLPSDALLAPYPRLRARGSPPIFYSLGYVIPPLLVYPPCLALGIFQGYPYLLHCRSAFPPMKLTPHTLLTFLIRSAPGQPGAYVTPPLLGLSPLSLGIFQGYPYFLHGTILGSRVAARCTQLVTDCMHA